MKDSCALTFSDIGNVGLATPLTMVAGGMGGGASSVPLRQVAKVQPKWTESRIMHRGGERCMTVTGEFARGVYAAPVESNIAGIMNNLKFRYHSYFELVVLYTTNIVVIFSIVWKRR